MNGVCRKCVLFAANRGYALSNSRAGLISHFLSAGWRVVLATSNDADSQRLVTLGARLEPIKFFRGGLALNGDLEAYRAMLRIHQKWRPIVSHNFHAKPAILGTLAARRALGNRAYVFNTITGLGYGMMHGGVTTRLAGVGYRFALPKADATVFQNPDDLAFFLRRGWVSSDRARLIPGSGVDLRMFKFVDRSSRVETAPVVVIVARLLKQKGIPEFVEVARRLRRRFPGARFLVAGEEDVDHPDSLAASWVRAQGHVGYLGRLSDVMSFLGEADLLLFPSYYREGVPRVVMEAAATGLPTVAFDVPGVREAVRDEETGYLCVVQDVDALTKRVSELLADRERRLAMGRAARRLAEAAFDVESVQGQYLSLYRDAAISI